MGLSNSENKQGDTLGRQNKEENKAGTRAPIEIKYGGKIIYRGPAYFNSGLRAEERIPFIIIPKSIAEKAGIPIKGITEAKGFTISYLGETDVWVEVRVASGKTKSKWVRARVYIDPFKKEPFINTTLCNEIGIKFLDWDEGLWILEEALPDEMKKMLKQLYEIAKKQKH